jgi:hypothetical protein
MIRVVAVIVIATVCAALFGVDATVLAQQTNASRQRIIEQRVSKMKVGDIVKGQRADGTKFEGVLVAKMADSVTVDVYRRRAFRRRQRMGTETITLVNLRDIKKPLSDAQIMAITGGIVAGGCLIAASIAASNLESQPGEHPPAASDEAPQP